MKTRSHVEARCAAMRAAKARKRLEGLPCDRPEPWQPPKLRRIVVVVDFDSGTPKIKMMQLLRSSRIDLYRVRTPRGESRKAVGWSRAIATVRKGYQRVSTVLKEGS